MFRWAGSVGALAAALALSLVAPAGAATGFLADETLTSATVSVPAVAIAPNGYAIAGWAEGASGAQVVRTSVRPPGGDWSAPQTFPVGLDSASGVSVAIASSGAAAVTWGESTAPSTFDVAVTTRAVGGAFGAPQILRDGTASLSPSVGIAASGAVTLLYTASPDAVLRDFPAGGSALAATLQPLAPNCSTSFGSGIAVAPSGDAVVPLSCGGAAFALRRGGRWAVSPTVPDDNPGGTCPSTTSYEAVSAAIDSAGDPVGVMRRTATSRFEIGFCQTFSTTIDLSLVLPLGGVMTAVPGPPAATATLGFGLGFPISGGRAVISPAGIVLAWADISQSLRAQQTARLFGVDGSAVGAPQPVGAAAAGVGAPALAVAADGRALLAWLQQDRPGGTLRLLVSERPPGGAFGDPAPIDAAGASSSVVAMSDGGDGLASWTVGTSAPYELHVRGFDASSPALNGASIPASATVGVPVAFSASPFDVWGPLTTTWSFGDGTSATGTAVQHAYASAGAFTATVTSTDAVGNATSRSGTVQVVAAGPSPGGAPRISDASLTHRRFRVGKRPTPLRGTIARRRRHAVPVGTTFRFRLDRAANVRIGFARQTRGVRNRAGDCVRRSRRSTRGRSCRLFVPAGTLVRSAPRGSVSIAFSGRVGRRALPPGRYRADLTAAVGGRFAKPTRLMFAIVR